MQKELITLFSRVHFHSSLRATVPEQSVVAFNAEIGVFGYTFDNSVLKRLRTLSTAEFDAVRIDVLANLTEVTGSAANHSVLFKKFPYSTPEQHDYMLRRVIGYFQNATGHVDQGNYQALSCGHVIDPSLLDTSQFGACPICQEQVDELDSPDVAQIPYAGVTPAKVLSFATGPFLGAAASTIVSRNSSISPAERAFVLNVSREHSIDRPDKVFRENLPLLYVIHSDVDYIAGLMSGATDVLRIAYFVSDNDADLSLKENVKFNLSTSHKKNVLKLLETQDDIREDLMRNRERWLRLAERLNTGSKENRRRFPKTAAAFDDLRRNQKSISTFGREVEKKVRAKTVDVALLDRLALRPGEFLRRLDFLLRTTQNPTEVLAALKTVANSDATSSKLMLEINKYLQHRETNEAEFRIFLPKGKTNKMQVARDARPTIDATVINDARRILEEGLGARFAKLDPMNRVYIDPALKGVVLPFNRRGDSNTAETILKGTRYPIGSSPVVRMFCHWTAPTDVDLSALFLDGDFNEVAQISFSDLRGGGAIHSGDIQSAPNGASEFIDFEIDQLRARDIRYAVMSVISYRGQKFDEFPCFAGFMGRDSLKSGQRYEPTSVKLKFDVATPSTQNMPVIFDLETREIVFADLVSGGRGRYNAIADQSTNLSLLARSILDLPLRKATVHDVLILHATARGTVVDDPNDADVVFTRDNVDLDEVLAMTV